MKITYGELPAVFEALSELGRNRLQLKETVRLHNLTKPFRTAMNEREQLRLAICRPYFPEGKDEPRPEDVEEVSAKVRELWRQEIEVDVKEPFDLTPYLGNGKDIELDENNLSLLVHLELVKIQ